METSVALLLELGVVLFLFTLLGAGARKVGLSPIPLYLVGGLALGEGGLAPVPASGEFISAGASIGVVLLLLTLGLEFSLGEFASSMRAHVPSGFVDLLLNAAPGALAGWLIGFDMVGVLALAAFLPLLAVLVAGGAWWQVLVGVGAAVAALTVAFVVSYRWGHHLGEKMAHPDDEQLLLRVLALTLIVAALAEYVHVSAAVGAFLVGLTLTGQTADRARTLLTPLRDLFGAIFFLSIGLAVDPRDLIPMLPAALVLAVVTGATKMLTGGYAARRSDVGRQGQLRAGTALVIRGEFSLVIVGLAGTADERLAPLVTAYVMLLAVSGPILTRFVGTGKRPTPAMGPD